jgi:hypothetical protein
MIFHLIKVAKHTWEPCCHLEAETGSWFTLIEKALVIFIILHIIYYQELVIMSGAGWVGVVYKQMYLEMVKLSKVAKLFKDINEYLLALFHLEIVIKI